MATVRHLALLAGQMGAEESEVHPDALTAAQVSLITGSLAVPDGSVAVISIENEGHWFRTDWRGSHALSTVHYGPGDDPWTTELLAIGVRGGGHINAAALAKALRLPPIVVTVVEFPDAQSARLCDIASWVGLALMQQRQIN
jgi:hypothetical protein